MQKYTRTILITLLATGSLQLTLAAGNYVSWMWWGSSEEPSFEHEVDGALAELGISDQTKVQATELILALNTKLIQAISTGQTTGTPKHPTPKSDQTPSKLLVNITLQLNTLGTNLDPIIGKDNAKKIIDRLATHYRNILAEQQ